MSNIFPLDDSFTKEISLSAYRWLPTYNSQVPSPACSSSIPLTSTYNSHVPSPAWSSSIPLTSHIQQPRPFTCLQFQYTANFPHTIATSLHLPAVPDRRPGCRCCPPSAPASWACRQWPPPAGPCRRRPSAGTRTAPCPATSGPWSSCRRIGQYVWTNCVIARDRVL